MREFVGAYQHFIIFGGILRCISIVDPLKLKMSHGCNDENDQYDAGNIQLTDAQAKAIAANLLVDLDVSTKQDKGARSGVYGFGTAPRGVEMRAM